MLPGTTQEPLHVQSNWNEGCLTEIVFKRLRPYTIHVLGLKYTTLQLLCTLADEGNLAQSLSHPKRCKCDSAIKGYKCRTVALVPFCGVSDRRSVAFAPFCRVYILLSLRRRRTVAFAGFCRICSVFSHYRICSVWGEIETVRDFLYQRAYKALVKLYISDLKYEQCRGEVF